MNKRHRMHKKGKGPKTGQRGPTPSAPPMKTAAWPGVPGKTQPRDRSAGYRKIKTSMRQEGC